MAQAGFREITATPNGLGGQVEGVQVYSVLVSARKGRADAAQSPAGAVSTTPQVADSPRRSCCG